MKDLFVNEVKAAKDLIKQKIPFLTFSDDNMYANRRFSKKLLKALIPLKIRYWTQCDISIARMTSCLSLFRKAAAE